MMHRLAILLSACFFAPVLWAKPLVIFDAGSSGTRIYVYDVEGENVTQLQSVKIKPGISDPKFANNPSVFNIYFNQLLGAVDDVLDAETKATTPIYLYATAGMRTLPADQQTTTFNAVRQYLGAQALNHGYTAPSDDQVRIISGSEEAMFIWISDNYLNGALNQPKLNTSNTYAALEMGGASSEIAFLSPKAKKHTQTLNHNGTPYPVYSYGYDGLGSDKAMARMLSSYSKGNTRFAACFPKGAPYPLTSSTLTGTGNFLQCVLAIQNEVIDLKANANCMHTNKGECSLLGVYQPSVRQVNHYLLTSGFFYAFEFLGLANQEIHVPVFTNASRAFCSMDWSTAQEEYSDTNPNYLVSYCFNMALTKVLLDDLHVSPRATLKAVSVVDDKPLEWPLGAALQLGR